MKQRAVFHWSGGKDSALALHKVRQSDQYEVLELLTTVSEPHRRVSMHGVRVELLDQQAARLGLPCRQLLLPDTPTMDAYEQLMGGALADLRQRGATVSIFGDIFLQDLRRYREAQLAKQQLRAVFPLWGASTAELIREFLGLGFKAITTCVSEKFLDQSFVGRVVDEEFLRDLPAHVDPCGENGEFHTFVFDGPLFSHPIPFEKGEIVRRTYLPAPKTDPAGYDSAQFDEPSPFATGFWYCDLLPVGAGE